MKTPVKFVTVPDRGGGPEISDFRKQRGNIKFTDITGVGGQKFQNKVSRFQILGYCTGQ